MNPSVLLQSFPSKEGFDDSLSPIATKSSSSETGRSEFAMTSHQSHDDTAEEQRTRGNNDSNIRDLRAPSYQKSIGSNSGSALRLPLPGAKNASNEPLVYTSNVHAVPHSANINITSAERKSSVRSANIANNDNESVYSEIASSFSNNFLVNFMKRDNPLKTGGLGKEYWLEDSSASKCFLCEKNFNTFRRKHHCRICGQIFCNQCTMFVSGESFNFNGRLRVCKSCISYADKYDDIASSDESAAEESNIGGGTDTIYPTRSNETRSSSVRGGNLIEQDVMVQEPTPPPKMAIPATRQGAAVEIPMRQHLMPRSFSRRVRMNGFSQSSHNFRSGLAVTSPVATEDVDSTYSEGAKLPVKPLQQFGPLGFNSTSNLFNYTHQANRPSSTFSPEEEINNNRSRTPSSQQPQLFSHEKSHYSDEESDDDEKSMSIYESMSNNKFDTDQFDRNLPRTKSAGAENMGSDSRVRLSRMNSQSRTERAQASLWRMKNRKRSKTAASKAYANLASSQALIPLQRSKTVIFENQPFNGMSKGNAEESSFEFNASPSGAASSKLFENHMPDKKRVFSLPNNSLKDSMDRYCENLLRQGLTDEHLENIDSWHSILCKILKHINKIVPDIRAGESLDIRRYVKLKRISGGSINSSAFIDGIVFSKNVALKSMPRELISPQICLVTFPIEYTKSEQHFMSLELVLAQEKESLHKLVGRIIALSPDILFVSASISGLALEMLDRAGITVVCNVKPQVIERIAKLTDADVVTSIDKLAVNPKLGSCDSFDVKQYVYDNIKRTYITLNGCIAANGGTILLRGGSPAILKKVKNIVEFMIYVYFNQNLEYSLFRDEYLTVANHVQEDFESIESKSTYLLDFIRKLRERHLSSSSFVKFSVPPLLLKARQADHKVLQTIEHMESLKRLHTRFSEGKSDIVPAEDEKDISEAYNSVRALSKILAMPELDFSKDMDFKIAEYIFQRQLESLRLSLQGWQRQWELFYSHSPYMLEPTSHQSLLFLYSMVNSKTATPCIGPEILGIDYYWLSDISLGQYIEHITVIASNDCTENCGHTLLDHYRSYVHGNGKVDVIVEPFQSRIPGLQNSILMWSYCKECRQSTPVIPMSENTWKYSFGKYLELSFWSENVTVIGSCPHDFKTHIRYFGVYNLAVRMEYSKVDTLEVIVPKFKLHWKPDISIKLKQEMFVTVRSKAKLFFDSIWERLDRVKVDSMTVDKMEAGQKRIAELKDKVDLEREQIMNMSEEMYQSTGVVEYLPLNSVIRNIQELSVEWDTEFQEFEVNFLPSEKDITRITSSQLRKLFLEKEGAKNEDEQAADQNESTKEDNLPDLEEKLSEKLEEETSNDTQTKTELAKQTKAILGANISEKIHMLESEKGTSGGKQAIVPPVTSTGTGSATVAIESSPKKQISLPNFVVSAAPSLKRKSSSNSNNNIIWPTKQLESELAAGSKSGVSANTTTSANGKVKQLTSLFDQLHFDQISMEFELQRERERRKAVANRYRAIPVIVSKPIVEVYKNVRDAVEEELSDSDNDNDETEARTEDTTGVAQNSNKDTNKGDHSGDDSKIGEEKQNNKAQQQKQEKDTTSLKPPLPQAERASLVKTLTSFWADRSAALWKPLAYPLSSTEHIFVDSDVIVREDEPSSLIAFCLSSSDYLSKLKTMREAEPTNHNTVHDNASTAISTANSFGLGKPDGEYSSVPVAAARAAPGDTTETDIGGNLSITTAPPAESISVQGNDLEKIMLKKTAIHLKYQFQEGSSLLSCKIFFAEQFDAFRQECGIDENFVQSLSRCVKWDSTGGKSGSAFLKTLDDRFIIKELSHAELDAFVKFAPSYFEYLAQALFHDLPTVLAKVFGFYQIHIRNPIDNKNVKLDLLIMENLFYDRKTSRIFDLKGSMRNRHVEQTGKENEVLLDENMVEYIYESPLFVKEYAKKLLRTSLWNDTLFLSRMNVMDYSLVIGIDSENHELVVGIIDCIRTFTWDKKLESWVKEKGLVGGGGKEPTVVTPRQYKNRFRDAMDRYILMVPDCWNQGPTE